MTATTERTIADFIAEHRITMTTEPRDSNPNMDDPKWDAQHWTCKLRRGRKQMSVPFSQGCAHTEPPTAADVLDCLASDAAGIENARTFEEWASEYGFDTDSRRAEKTYRACERLTGKLTSFLGHEAYDVLVFHTERL